MEWPDNLTFPLLIVGLLPLFYVLGRLAIGGLAEAASLRFAATIFVWIGYQLSPWLAWFSDSPWTGFLIVPEMINEGLIFSTLCMLGLLLGYESLATRSAHAAAAPGSDPLAVSTRRLAIWMAVSLVLFLINVGGPDEVWYSSRLRGEGQFETRDAMGEVIQAIMVGSLAFHLLLAALAAVMVVNGRVIRHRLLGLVGLVVASLGSIHDFSRGSGFAFLILAVLAVRLKSWRALPLVAASLFVAVSLGHIGLNERGGYTGLGNFIEAALNPDTSKPPEPLDAEFNPLDAMAAWTRKATISADVDPLEVIPVFFWDLAPLPSQILPVLPIGRDLAEEMGTVGSTGLTTPAYTQLYIVFGHWGALLTIALGAAYAFFDRVMREARHGGAVICLLLCVASVGIGLHSSARAMTRPLLFAAIIHVIAASRHRAPVVVAEA